MPRSKEDVRKDIQKISADMKELDRKIKSFPKNIDQNQNRTLLRMKADYNKLNGQFRRLMTILEKM